MNKRANTKRALVLSVLSLLLCTSLLIGSTFAWFTDTASTAVNTIQAGNLKIDLVGEDGQTLVGRSISFKKAAGHEKEPVLFEPGATYQLSGAKIVNTGDLAVKFKVVVNGLTGDAAKLADVLDVMIGDKNCGVLSKLSVDEDGIAHGTLLPKGEAELQGLALHMQESANNDYQGLTLEGITLTVYATQAASEYDSFDNTYDEKAEFDEPVKVSSVDELTTAIAAGKPVTVTGNIELGSTGEPALELSGENVNANITINNGSVVTIPESSNAIYVEDGATLVLDGGGTLSTVISEEYNDTLIECAYGSKVVIESGNYVRGYEQNTDYPPFALISCQSVENGEKAEIIINGGYFDSGYYSTDTTSLLNGLTMGQHYNAMSMLEANGTATITIYNGTFVGYNPVNGLGDKFFLAGQTAIGDTPDGYTITESTTTDGTNRPVYTVTYNK